MNLDSIHLYLHLALKAILTESDKIGYREMNIKMKNRTWRLDETSKHFITVILEDNKQDIIEFRRRWKLEEGGLEDRNFFNTWKEKIKKERLNLCREVKVNEIEVIHYASDALLLRPILSSEIEGKPREENWGDSLEATFVIEIRALGLALQFPPEWDRLLEYFVIYDRINFDLILNRGITVSVRYRIHEDLGLISENVCLILGENTGSEDLDNFWKQKIKPLLVNLPARIKDLKRKSKNALISEKRAEIDAIKKDLQKSWRDPATGKVEKELDRDIAIESMEEEKVDKLYRGVSSKEEKKINEKLGKKVQNIRYYRTKRHP